VEFNTYSIFFFAYCQRQRRRRNERTMPQAPYQAELELAKSAALKAGEIIRTYSGNSGRSNNSAAVSVKSGVDLVTEADTHVERVVTQIIKAAFPDDDIVGEEDEVESPKGGQDDPFPAGRVWCGKTRVLCDNGMLMMTFHYNYNATI
jgi:hypothetical protein